MPHDAFGTPTTESGPYDAEDFYIHTPASPADERDLVLKQNDTFAVFDRFGDIRPIGLAEQGLYHDGTRFLSTLSLRMGRQRPLLLSSAVRSDNAWITVDVTNADLYEAGVLRAPHGVLHLSRILLLCDGVLHQRFTLHNYGLSTVVMPLLLRFAADYADIFEVRGTKRERRGQPLAPVVSDARVMLGYLGLDGVTRRTSIDIDPAPQSLDTSAAMFDCRLAPHEEREYLVTFTCEQDAVRPARVAFPQARLAATGALRARRSDTCTITTSNHQFNEWIERSHADLAMMITETPHGPYPYAGVPWFSTPFGRDGLITALETLWVQPGIARGVLLYLAATQATGRDPRMDAAPGKILHETRTGEMAALGEIPFGRYYGSHDATPLFVMVAAAYYRATGDRELIVRIWPALLAALRWIEHEGDLDGDGFIEYARQTPTGLVQQGWKDSHDSVSHQDGQLAAAPIALCEIQGYVYAAWRGAAALAAALGLTDLVARWTDKAEHLRASFEREFWDETIGTYALALDADKRRCGVRSSNAGQVLFSGIASSERAEAVARLLLTPENFSGWGIRTLASNEVRFNPMSYHNGSVWPHDNALVAAGCARYGRHDAALAVLSGLFDASVYFDLHRLPELFCGFPRRQNEGPTQYPVACNPQAWASASVFLLLQAALGLDIDTPAQTLRFTRPRLPEFLERLRLVNLRVGHGTVDLLLERHQDDVGITVQRRAPGVEIIALK